MSKYLTFVQIVDIMTTNSGKAERDYKGKHFTGAKTDFGLKEKAMVFMKGDEKKGKVNEEIYKEEPKIEKLECDVCHFGSEDEEQFRKHFDREFHKRCAGEL